MKLNQLLSTNLRAMVLGLSGIFAVANGLTAFGYDFSAKNSADVEIFYNINPDGKTLTVSYGAQKYTAPGIHIPQEVTYEGKKYTVTAIGQQAFHESYTENFTLPNTVTEIQKYAFSSCKKIKTFNFPTDLKYIREEAFWESSIENCNLPEGLKVIGKGAFRESHVKSLYLPSTLTDVEGFAFAKCLISEVTIPGCMKIVPESLFSGCSKLHKVIVDSGVEELENSVFSGCAMDSIVFPSTLKKIGKYCFASTKLKNIVLPNSVNEIGVGCFEQLYELESVTFSSGMVSIPAGVCKECRKLVKVTIPEGVKSIGQEAFYSTSLLSHVTLPESIIEVGRGVFKASGLSGFTFPKNLAYISTEMFQSCNNLTEITIPSNIVKIGDSAFESCSQLRKVILPETLEDLGKKSFSSCSSLEEVNIPSNIKVLSEYIFSDCKSLKSVVVPEGIIEIGNDAFLRCEKLSELQLPKSISKIYGNFINGCKLLKSLTIHHQVSGVSQAIFHGCSLEELHFRRAVLPVWIQTTYPQSPVIKPGNNCTLYVPKGSAETYKASEFWNTFNTIVEEEIAEALNYQLSFPYSLTGGQILVNGEAAKGGVMEFEMGSDIVISTTAKDGYHLRALLVNGKDVTAEMEDGSYTIRNIDANYTVDAEFAENPFILSLFMANGGSLDVDVEKRGIFTCVIVPEEGWKINTVTFNGSDVTSELTEDNRYTTPAITRNSVLRVTFEDMNSAIGNIDYDATSVKVTVDNGGEVRIEGVEAGNPVRAYSVDGRLAGQVTSNGDVDVITLSQHGIYLIQTPGKTFKIQY